TSALLSTGFAPELRARKPSCRGSRSGGPARAAPAPTAAVENAQGEQEMTRAPWHAPRFRDGGGRARPARRRWSRLQQRPFPRSSRRHTTVVTRPPRRRRALFTFAVESTAPCS